MAREQPINAEVPATGDPGKGKKPEKPSAPPPPRKRGLGAMPLPLKLISGAIVLATVFLGAAIVGGGNHRDELRGAAAPVGGEAETTPTQVPTQAREPTDLGYPAFATKNTTRIGGSDPAANAAGAALAVFPSTNPGEAPAAVTLVDEGDWPGAIAASVLMAAPVRAPALISAESGLPDVSAEALSALDPQGSAATHGAAHFAIGEADAPDADTTRVRAHGPAATAAAIAKLRQRLTGSPPDHIVVAPLQKSGFAMPAAAWSARSGDPVLFAEGDKLPAPTAAVLRKDKKASVYVLGPTSAISSDVLRKIAKISPRVHRVSGEHPVENAIAFARYRNGDFGWNVNDPGHGFVVARSEDPLDAAAASPLSAAGTWGPLLLTDDAGTLPTALRGYLLDVKPGYTDDPTRAFYNHVWVIGDQEAIEVGQQAEIDSLAELAKIGGGG